MVEAQKILRGGERDEASSVEKSDTRAEKKRFANIVRDENDSFAETASQGAELALKFGAGDGIEGAKRLVHQKDGRIGGERAGDTDALALAARKFVWMAGGKFGRVETYQAK